MYPRRESQLLISKIDTKNTRLVVAKNDVKLKLDFKFVGGASRFMKSKCDELTARSAIPNVYWQLREKCRVCEKQVCIGQTQKLV